MPQGLTETTKYVPAEAQYIAIQFPDPSQREGCGIQPSLKDYGLNGLGCNPGRSR